MDKMEKLPKFIKMIVDEKSVWYYTLNFKIQLGEYNTDTGEQDEQNRTWIASYRCYDSFDSDVTGEDENLFGAADKLLEALNKHIPEIIEAYKEESGIEVEVGCN